MLSPERVFVLHLDSRSDPAAGRLIGRVEHVQSGDSIRFASGDELYAFLGRGAAEGPVGGDAANEEEER